VGKTTCSNCGGDLVLEHQEDCSTCKHGKVMCQECDGEGSGQCRDCDGSGLKLTICYAFGGSGLNNGYYGACGVCNGSAMTMRPCTKCNGSGNFGCDDCNGQGYMSCNECVGKGFMISSEHCEKCSETGKEKCSWCKGEGYGNSKANIFFIGIEEHGDWKIESLIDSYFRNLDNITYDEYNSRKKQIKDVFQNSNYSIKAKIEIAYTKFNIDIFEYFSECLNSLVATKKWNL